MASRLASKKKIPGTKKRKHASVRKPEIKSQESQALRRRPISAKDDINGHGGII